MIIPPRQKQILGRNPYSKITLPRPVSRLSKERSLKRQLFVWIDGKYFLLLLPESQVIKPKLQKHRKNYNTLPNPISFISQTNSFTLAIKWRVIWVPKGIRHKYYLSVYEMNWKDCWCTIFVEGLLLSRVQIFLCRSAILNEIRALAFYTTKKISCPYHNFLQPSL